MAKAKKVKRQVRRKIRRYKVDFIQLVADYFVLSELQKLVENDEKFQKIYSEHCRFAVITCRDYFYQRVIAELKHLETTCKDLKARLVFKKAGKTEVCTKDKRYYWVCIRGVEADPVRVLKMALKLYKLDWVYGFGGKPYHYLATETLRLFKNFSCTPEDARRCLFMNDGDGLVFDKPQNLVFRFKYGDDNLFHYVLLGHVMKYSIFERTWLYNLPVLPLSPEVYELVKKYKPESLEFFKVGEEYVYTIQPYYREMEVGIKVLEATKKAKPVIDQLRKDGYIYE